MAEINVTSAEAFDRLRALDPDPVESLDMLQHLAFLAPSAVIAAADAAERRRTPTAERKPTCRICGCTTRKRCESGCTWMCDPEAKGHICSTHFVIASDLTVGQIVRTFEWADGQPVRIIAIHDGGTGQTVIHWQDVSAHHHACVVVVGTDIAVLPVGGGR